MTGGVVGFASTGLERAGVGGRRWRHELPGRADAERAFDQFIETCEAKYLKAARSLVKDREASMTFYAYPATHWRHLRTTNPIESMFATIQHRTAPAKGWVTRASRASVRRRTGENYATSLTSPR
ncbi:MAG: transposase [Pseudomonadota bacterium]|nr:transposase [Pseudomonadota bacterium]